MISDRRYVVLEQVSKYSSVALHLGLASTDVVACRHTRVVVWLLVCFPGAVSPSINPIFNV